MLKRPRLREKDNLKALLRREKKSAIKEIGAHNILFVPKNKAQKIFFKQFLGLRARGSKDIVGDLLKLGYSAERLKQIGFRRRQMGVFEISPEDLKRLGFTFEDFIQDLILVFESSLTKAVPLPNFVNEARLEGFTPEEIFFKSNFSEDLFRTRYFS